MQSRRDFLKRGSLWLAGGLLVGDAALEALDRLAHTKVFALGAPKRLMEVTTGSQTLAELYRKMQGPLADALRMTTPEFQWMRDTTISTEFANSVIVRVDHRAPPNSPFLRMA